MSQFRQWIDDAIGVVRRDLRAARAPEVRFSVEGGSGLAFECTIALDDEPVESVVPLSQAMQPIPAAVAVAIGSWVQDLLADSDAWQQRPWPECPVHTQHQLVADVLGDYAVWTCAADESFRTRVGSYRPPE